MKNAIVLAFFPALGYEKPAQNALVPESEQEKRTREMILASLLEVKRKRKMGVKEPNYGGACSKIGSDADAMPGRFHSKCCYFCDRFKALVFDDTYHVRSSEIARSMLKPGWPNGKDTNPRCYHFWRDICEANSERFTADLHTWISARKLASMKAVKCKAVKFDDFNFTTSKDEMTNNSNRVKGDAFLGCVTADGKRVPANAELQIGWKCHMECKPGYNIVPEADYKPFECQLAVSNLTNGQITEESLEASLEPGTISCRKDQSCSYGDLLAYHQGSHAYDLTPEFLENNFDKREIVGTATREADVQYELPEPEPEPFKNRHKEQQGEIPTLENPLGFSSDTGEAITTGPPTAEDMKPDQGTRMPANLTPNVVCKKDHFPEAFYYDQTECNPKANEKVGILTCQPPPRGSMDSGDTGADLAADLPPIDGYGVLQPSMSLPAEVLGMSEAERTAQVEEFGAKSKSLQCKIFLPYCGNSDLTGKHNKAPMERCKKHTNASDCDGHTLAKDGKGTQDRSCAFKKVSIADEDAETTAARIAEGTKQCETALADHMATESPDIAQDAEAVATRKAACEGFNQFVDVTADPEATDPVLGVEFSEDDKCVFTAMLDANAAICTWVEKHPCQLAEEEALNALSEDADEGEEGGDSLPIAESYVESSESAKNQSKVRHEISTKNKKNKMMTTVDYHGDTSDHDVPLSLLGRQEKDMLAEQAENFYGSSTSFLQVGERQTRGEEGEVITESANPVEESTGDPPVTVDPPESESPPAEGDVVNEDEDGDIPPPAVVPRYINTVAQQAAKKMAIVDSFCHLKCQLVNEMWAARENCKDHQKPPNCPSLKNGSNCDTDCDAVYKIPSCQDTEYTWAYLMRLTIQSSVYLTNYLEEEDFKSAEEGGEHDFDVDEFLGQMELRFNQTDLESFLIDTMKTSLTGQLIPETGLDEEYTPNCVRGMNEPETPMDPPPVATPLSSDDGGAR